MIVRSPVLQSKDYVRISTTFCTAVVHAFLSFPCMCFAKLISHHFQQVKIAEAQQLWPQALVKRQGRISTPHFCTWCGNLGAEFGTHVHIDSAGKPPMREKARSQKGCLNRHHTDHTKCIPDSSVSVLMELITASHA